MDQENNRNSLVSHIVLQIQYTLSVTIVCIRWSFMVMKNTLTIVGGWGGGVGKDTPGIHEQKNTDMADKEQKVHNGH